MFEIIMKKEKKMKRIVTSLILVFFISVYSAFGINITQITNNSDYDRSPALYDGQIAWEEEDNEVIYFWDGSTIDLISDGVGIHNMQPSLYNGVVAWVGVDPATYDDDVFYWDSSTGTDNSLSRSTFCLGPSIDSSGIAWTENEEVYYWNNTTTTRITNDALENEYLSLHNGTIAYEKYDGNDGEIVYWNGSTSMDITSNSTNDFFPSHHNGQIAWCGDDGTDLEIFIWNGSTTIQLTDNSVHDYSASLYNGTIAWVHDDGNDDEIMYWDGTTTYQLTDNDFDDRAPSLYEETIAWMGHDGNDYEIFYATDITNTDIVNQTTAQNDVSHKDDDDDDDRDGGGSGGGCFIHSLY